MSTVNIDPNKCCRRKVTAEMTVGHLEQIAREMGISFDDGEGLEFLNQHGRAYEMWRVMMRAAEEYLKTELREVQVRPQHARAWAAVHAR
jgi:hypothetical protein